MGMHRNTTATPTGTNANANFKFTNARSSNLTSKARFMIHTYKPMTMHTNDGGRTTTDDEHAN
eukprot:6808075-Pyramimonas_sp.AAC.1